MRMFEKSTKTVCKIPIIAQHQAATLNTFSHISTGYIEQERNTNQSIFAPSQYMKLRYLCKLYQIALKLIHYKWLSARIVIYINDMPTMSITILPSFIQHVVDVVV